MNDIWLKSRPGVVPQMKSIRNDGLFRTIRQTLTQPINEDVVHHLVLLRDGFDDGRKRRLGETQGSEDFLGLLADKDEQRQRGFHSAADVRRCRERDQNSN